MTDIPLFTSDADFNLSIFKEKIINKSFELDYKNKIIPLRYYKTTGKYYIFITQDSYWLRIPITSVTNPIVRNKISILEMNDCILVEINDGNIEYGYVDIIEINWFSYERFLGKRQDT